MKNKQGKSLHVSSLIQDNSGFHAVRSLWIKDSRYLIPDCYHLRDFGFLELNFGFQSPKYQIPVAKICQIPESALSYIRRDKNIDY